MKKIDRSVVIVSSLIFISALVFVGFIWLISSVQNDIEDRERNDFGTFSSCRDLSEYVNANFINDFYYGIPEPIPLIDSIDEFSIQEDSALGAPPSSSGRGESRDFSETNIQVEGVNEADIVKTDGSSLFVINDVELVIFDVSEINNPIELSRTEVSANPIEMFLYEEKLIIFGRDFADFRNSNLDGSRTDVVVYDVSNLENPNIIQEIRLQGNYVTSRMIDNNFYLVSNSSFYDYGEVTETDIERYVPLISDRTEREYFKAADCSEISYFGSTVNGFVTILSLDVENTEYNSEVLLGDTSNVYMSPSNLYLSSLAYEYEEYENDDFRYDFELDVDIRPKRPPVYREIISTNTEIFKLGLDGNNVEFSGKGRVRGTVLNQFSMDEKDGYFRVATTINDWNGWGPDSENVLYVLNEDLEEVSKVDGLGLDERIYSVRYFGDRAYMVTFRQVDPLYVIDLSDQESPEVLGELKIPGFSNYLHPYDEDHLIGIGKDASEVTGRAEGLKIALFDVTDVTNPVVKNEIIMGETGSDSEVLNNHKAFLFDKERELMVIPVSIYETEEETSIEEIRENIRLYFENLNLSIVNINESVSYIEFDIIDKGTNPEELIRGLEEIKGVTSVGSADLAEGNFGSDEFTSFTIWFSSEGNSYPTFKYSGFSVIEISEDVLEVRNNIIFQEGNDDRYYYNYGNSRSLYIEDTLFTIMNGEMKLNNIEDLNLLAEIDL